MRIEHPGDPAKKYVDPAQFEYRFQCGNCGCVFVESGTECRLMPLYGYGKNDTLEIVVSHSCPNCREEAYGEKI